MRPQSISSLVIMASAGVLAASIAAANPPAGPPVPPAETPELNTAMTDVDFLMTAAASDEFERRSGAIASQRGQREDVRTLGQRLIVDHTRSTEQIVAASTEAGLPPPTPVLHPGLQRKLQELETVPTEIFDQVFLQQQAEAHVDARALMRTCIKTCDAMPLREVASKVVVVIQKHLSHVLRLQRSFEAPAT